MTITIQHIKGYQDSGKNKLLYNAELNVQTDALATSAVGLKGPEQNLIPLANGSFCAGELLISAKYKKYLRRGFLSMGYREYLQTTYQWKCYDLDAIWWEAFESAILSLTPFK
jgi:hypothetical protein